MLRSLGSIKKLIKDPAISGTLVVTLGALIGSFFNYLLQFFLGRKLSVADFGVFNALLSFSVILSVLAGSLSTALVKTVVEVNAQNRFDVLTKLFRKLSIGFLAVGFLIFGLVYLLQKQILGFFQIDNPSYVIGFASYLSLTFLSILAPSFLQGLLRFNSYAFWSVIASIVRLLVPVFLVLLGYKVGAVFLGIGFALLFSYFLSIFFLKKDFTLFDELPLKSYYKKILLFTGPVIFINLGMTVLNNVDMILVKHYFDAETAGLYSGVVTLGKIFLFGAGTVCVVMFPQISSSYAKKEDPFAKVAPFLLLQLGVLICGFLIFSIFPGLVTRVMFGERYLSSVEYLPRFSIFVVFYVIANFFTMFLLAIDKTRIFLLHVVAVLMQLVLISKFHWSIRSVIDMNIISSAFLSTALLGYFMYLFLKQKKVSGRIH